MLRLRSATEAMAKAAQIAGSDDFGAGGFHEGLERALAAFTDLSLTPEARDFAFDKIVRDLVARLHIEQWYQTHPEVDSQRVKGPVVVVGLPRTGTSATVAMLALDSRFRFLRKWEAATPIPPPVAGEEQDDPRAVAAREAATHYDKAHMHLFDPEGPEEDLALLAGLDMHSYHGAYPMPEDYLTWWLSEDFKSTYACLERVFKLLQSRRPPNLWLLKSPPHLFRLDAIARQFPHVKFVMTHRSPLKVLGSVASLHYTLWSQRCMPGTVRKEAVGPGLLRFWKEGMRRALAARATLGEDRFVDVFNDELVLRPLKTFERIYAHLDMELSEDLKQRLLAYRSRNAPGTFGSHRYTLEEYGLTADAVCDAFSSYMRRFAP